MRPSRNPVPLSVVASRFRGAFPNAVAPNVDACLAALSVHHYPPSEDDIGPVSVGGEAVSIPYRIYAQTPVTQDVLALSETQQLVLACLLSRHHDGFERQRQVPQLLSASAGWVAPFLLQLVGEYVVEIVEVIANHRNDLRHQRYVQFAAANSRFIALTKRRVVSYWNEYYRCRFPVFGDYPGFKVLEALELWDRNDVPKLLAR